MPETSFYTKEELESLGIKKCGSNVLISKKCSIYSPELISIGDNVRIDDFCLLTGNISIGSHVHIAAYSALYGKCGITLEDHTGTAPRSTILSAMDDFSGEYVPGPTHSDEITNVQGGEVKICKYGILGAHSIMLPSTTIAEGTVVGVMSVLKSGTAPWSIYMGIPARRIKERSKDMLKLI